MPSLHIEIEGMTCEHCVRAIRHRLSSTDGIRVTDVKVGSADIEYDASKVTTAEIEDVISDEGYTVDTISELTR